MPIIIRALIIPETPAVSFEEYNNAEPMKIAEDRILPASNVLLFGFALSI
jgi:hypothetical protein